MTDYEMVEQKMVDDVLMEEGGVELPTPGRIVWYQTDGRNDLDYYLPAIIVVTRQSHPGDYPDGRRNSLPVPSSNLHVHLTVFTPGGYGSIYHSDEGEATSWQNTPQSDLLDLGRPTQFVPGSGTYVEWDVPYASAGVTNTRRSWRWPQRS